MMWLLSCADGRVDTADTAVTAILHPLAVATVASDYTAGQLAVVDWESGVVHDALFPTAGDTAVAFDMGKLFVLERSVENTVRMYTPDDYSAPEVELATGDSSNPQAAALCNDTIVVVLYDVSSLGLYDAGTGLPTGTIDLSTWDDGDGAEPFSLVRAGGQLYVSLNRLDRSTTTWSSADGTGTILQVDCASLTVVDAWETGPNPSLLPWPQDASRFILQTGDYFNDDFTVRLDGALQSFSPETGISEPIFTEEALGANLGPIAGAADDVVLITNDGRSWSTWCANLSSGALVATEPVDAFISDAVSAPDGTAWLAYRAGFAGTGAPVVEGLVPWDPVACTRGEPLALTLPPVALALQ